MRIKQKTVKYTPFDKLRDAFVLLLTGAHRMVEINTTLRADPALCEAFGMTGCAEQSVVQDTLDACTDANVEQMRQAMHRIFRQHSRVYRHNYQKQWQLLDIDLSGRECGRTAEDVTKGYFAHHKGAYGRQEGRGHASLYDEIVCERLFLGNTTTAAAILPLLADAQDALQLTPSQRARTLIRLDAGGGTVEEVNACLEAGYPFHGKDFSTARARKLAKSVQTCFKQDQQGLGRRNKKCFAAQALLLWLECLAHNVLVWARSWLAPAAPAIAGYGLLRLVRDAFAIPGRVYLDAKGGMKMLILCRSHPLAVKMQQALQKLLVQQQTRVCLGEI